MLCNNVKTRKKRTGLHSFSRKYIFEKAAAGAQIDSKKFYLSIITL